MNIIKKLATALQGGIRESGEMMVDANGMRIFAQEIHQCEHSITQSKQQLASIIAQKTKLKRALEQLQKGMALNEEKIALLLAQDKEEEALQLAELIAEKEPLILRQQQQVQQMVEYERSLQQTLKKRVNRLSSYRSEYQMLQATEHLQTAQRKLSAQSSHGQSSFTDMQDSLNRIQQRQQHFSDQESAMEQVDAYLEGADMSAQATVNSKARDILEGIRNKK
ncbi:MAG: PspA/IM30 family protein [Cocleimonas sp.]|nr:PspA/IM30 family protein [Cocleimonas sp.]